MSWSITGQTIDTAVNDTTSMLVNKRQITTYGEKSMMHNIWKNI